jgi:Acetyltransferase (GNAT) domain
MTAFRLAEVTRSLLSESGVGVSSPAPRGDWEAVLVDDPRALVDHTPAWTDLVCRVGAYEDASRLYELPGGRRLVLPMVRRRHLPEPLAFEASFPASWGIGGIVAPGGVRPADVATVFADLAKRNVVRASLRPNPLDAQAFDAAEPLGAVVTRRLAHVLDLAGGFSRVWKEGFTTQARTHVRKAERSGLTVECDTSGRLVPVLYELFDRSIDRWAEQQHEPPALSRWRGHRRDPRRKFELMAESLGEACRLWVAWREGQAAAALLILVLPGANAHSSRSVMDKELAGPTRANYLLQQLAMENACDSGCRHYHLGESGSSASLAHFKANFGARPYPYSQYAFERLPITALDRQVRGAAKRLIGFRDPAESRRTGGGPGRA